MNNGFGGGSQGGLSLTGGPGTMSGTNPETSSAGQPDYSLAGILHYLQSEWRRYERDRNEWEIERAEMRVSGLAPADEHVFLPICSFACFSTGTHCPSRGRAEGHRASQDGSDAKSQNARVCAPAGEVSNLPAYWHGTHADVRLAYSLSHRSKYLSTTGNTASAISAAKQASVAQGEKSISGSGRTSPSKSEADGGECAHGSVPNNLLT